MPWLLLTFSMATPEETAQTPSIELTENMVAAYFYRLSDAFGLPRSAAALFTVLFLSPTPLTFDDIVRESGVSKASASTGLRLLQRLKAVEQIVRQDERRTYYRAETSARRLVAGLINGTIVESLNDGDRLLDEAAEIALQNQNSHHLQRIQILQRWHHRARKFLPLVGRIT